MLVVEKIENGKVFCEDEGKKLKAIPVALIKGTVKTGDVLVRKGLKYEIDRDTADERTKKIAGLFDELVENTLKNKEKN